MSRLLLLVATLLSLCSPAAAHTLSLSVLNIRQVSDDSFTLVWERVDGLHDPKAVYLVLRPRFPAQCKLSPPSLRCAAPGLAGSVTFPGLVSEPNATVLVHIDWLDAPDQSFSATGSDPMLTIIPEGREGVAWTTHAATFTRLGVEHIWFGWDHLAFVLGLLWLVSGRVMLVKTITAFTLAHSLTLSSATLGLFALPGPPTEAVIALSVTLLAVELITRERTGYSGLTSRAPWLVAFAFGLLHGFGFAGALAELEIAKDQRLLALGFFNLGVELGQLAFVLAVSLAVLLLRRLFGARLSRASVPLQYAIGTLGIYWATERITGFF